MRLRCCLPRPSGWFFGLVALTITAGLVQSQPPANSTSRADALLNPAAGDPAMARLEELAREGRLPDYEDLRLPMEGGIAATERYLMALPVLDDDRITTELVFADVPRDSPYAALQLPDLVKIALDNNFDVRNSIRDVEIARSNTRESLAFFIPFVDLVGDARYSRTQEIVQDTTRPYYGDGSQVPLDPTATSTDPNVPIETVESQPYTTRRATGTQTVEPGLELTQNLPTGGNITGDFTEQRTFSDFDDGSQSGFSENYQANAQVRFLQPLLRGSGLLTGEGTDIGTANLRDARLAEMDAVLGDKIRQRDVVLDVIRTYFQLLQTKQQLLVSRDAIRERYRFLDETRVKFDVGRVAESEILRAQIQFLQEVETAINRQQQLDNAREDLLISLGLPLETPISLVDVTPTLIARGRYEIPPVQDVRNLAITRRPELMRSDISISRAEINAQVARNNRLPQLDFDTGYRTFDEAARFNEAQDFDTDVFDAGVTLRIPLQNLQARERHRRSVIGVEQRRTTRQSIERDLIQQVLSAHRAVLTNEARLTVSRQRVEQARRNLELINGSFEVGFSSVTEVRLAQDDLFDAETAYSNAVLGYQTNIAQLYVALGLPLY